MHLTQLVVLAAIISAVSMPISSKDLPSSLTQATLSEVKRELIPTVKPDDLKTKIYTARVTKYTLQESCHFRKGNFCPAANGKEPVAGKTVACPRHLPLGTKVKIAGNVYECTDRYSRWVQEKHGDTYDIFTTDYQAAIQWGAQQLTVTIYE